MDHVSNAVFGGIHESQVPVNWVCLRVGCAVKSGKFASLVCSRIGYIFGLSCS